MQREIEALLVAYLNDRNKETQMIQDLLSALAVGAEARHRMVRDLTSAVMVLQGPAPGAAAPPPATKAGEATGEITAAIAQLRSSREPSHSTH